MVPKIPNITKNMKYYFMAPIPLVDINFLLVLAKEVYYYF